MNNRIDIPLQSRNARGVRAHRHALVVLYMMLSACFGGGGGGGNVGPAGNPVLTFSVGGTVSGVIGTGLVLQNNGTDNLAVGGNGGFTFATAVDDGKSYTVTVLTQPSGETCVVNQGTGKVSGANITGVTVQCAPPLSSTVDNWVPNGSVSAVALSADQKTVYIGGDFTQVGPRTGSFVPLSATSGATVGSFPKVDGTVAAAVSDAKGGWFIGGVFSLVGSTARNHLAHILADGSVDTNWNPNPLNDPTNSGSVSASGTGINALALSSDSKTLYVGGYFSLIGGKKRQALAAIDATSGTANAWQADTNGNAVVQTLVLIAGNGSDTLYVGGRFIQLGANPHLGIARMSTDGMTAAIDETWRARTQLGEGSGDVNAIALGNGVVYVAGRFEFAGGNVDPKNPSSIGLPRKHVAALDIATGDAIVSWNPNADDRLYALAVSGDGNTVFVGGVFANIGGQPRNRLAALNVSDGNATSWNPNASNEVRTLATAGTTLYAGGAITTVEGIARNNIVAFDTTTNVNSVMTWNPNANGAVSCLIVSGNTIYAGGGFSSVGGITRNHLAALDVASGALIDTWNPNPGRDSAHSYDIAHIKALAVSGGTVYVSGAFEFIGGLNRTNLAALDANGNAISAWNADPALEGGSINALALSASGDTMFAGEGGMTVKGGKVFALNATSGALVMAWTTNPVLADDEINALMRVRDILYVGGHFNAKGAAGNFGGLSRNYLAAMNAGTGAVTAWDPNADPSTTYVTAVSALSASPDGKTIYTGGNFSTVGGATNNRIAALDATSGASVWNAVSGMDNGGVGALAPTGDGKTLYAGGNFYSVGGNTRYGVAALNPINGELLDWSPLPWGAQAQAAVNALAASDTSVLAGGSFSSIGGEARSNFAFVPR